MAKWVRRMEEVPNWERQWHDYISKVLATRPSQIRKRRLALLKARNTGREQDG